MLRLKALDHVGLLVADLDRSLHFYQALGLELLRRSEPQGNHAGSAVLAIGTQEINVFCRPDLGGAASSAVHPIDHFCLLVDSPAIDEVVAGLQEAGIEIARGPIPRRDGASVFVTDPDGIRVELQIKQ